VLTTNRPPLTAWGDVLHYDGSAEAIVNRVLEHRRQSWIGPRIELVISALTPHQGLNRMRPRLPENASQDTRNRPSSRRSVRSIVRDCPTQYHAIRTTDRRTEETINSPNRSRKLFRLLIAAGTHLAPSSASIELGRKRWVLTDAAPIPNPPDCPSFVCVSYAWGSGRVAHPSEPNRFISDRTVPAMEAAVLASHPQALWVDSFCVPSGGPVRSACLMRMGRIYSAASQVVVVLSKGCGEVLAEIATNRRVTEDQLATLEQDAWVSRAWTYQEAANCRKLVFAAEGWQGSRWTEVCC